MGLNEFTCLIQKYFLNFKFEYVRSMIRLTIKANCISRKFNCIQYLKKSKLISNFWHCESCSLFHPIY